MCLSLFIDHDGEYFKLSPGYIRAYSTASISAEEPGSARLHCLMMASKAEHPEMW